MKNIRMSKPFLLSISVLLAILNPGYASEAPIFKSKLFESGNLLISDDFDAFLYIFDGDAEEHFLTDDNGGDGQNARIRIINDLHKKTLGPYLDVLPSWAKPQFTFFTEQLLNFTIIILMITNFLNA